MVKRGKVRTLFVVMMLFITTASLAVFTDKTQGSVSNKAGFLSIETGSVSNNLANMKAGESRTFKTNHKFKGSLDGKARLVIEDNGAGLGKLTSCSNTGYCLSRLGKEVELKNGKAVIDLGKVKDNQDLSQELVLKLGINSGNEYQGTKVNVKVTLEVMQDRHTTWTQVDSGEIKI